MNTGRMMRVGLIAIGIVIVATMAISLKSEDIGVDFSAFEGLSAEIQKAKTLVVYRGFPRREQLTDDEPEPKKDPNFALRGYFFQPRAYACDEKAMEKLRELCSTQAAFSKWRGPKKCGGYHPDYCLQFKNGDTMTSVLLCYGCNEAKFFGNKANLYVDANAAALEAIQVILKQVTADAKE